MANPLESVRRMTDLALNALKRPGHMHREALISICDEGNSVLSHIAEQKPIDDVDAWGDENPTEACRR